MLYEVITDNSVVEDGGEGLTEKAACIDKPKQDSDLQTLGPEERLLSSGLSVYVRK